MTNAEDLPECPFPVQWYTTNLEVILPPTLPETQTTAMDFYKLYLIYAALCYYPRQRTLSAWYSRLEYFSQVTNVGVSLVLGDSDNEEISLHHMESYV